MKEEIEYIHWHKLIASQLALWQIKERVPADMAESNPSEGFITMSRMHGAGGDDVAQAIGKKLGWQVFDKELVEYIAVTAKVRKSVVESFDEKRQSDLQNWVHTLIDAHTLATDKYLKYLISVILTIAEHGQAVIIGRGSNYVLSAEKGVRILVTAPLLWRTKQLAMQRKISEKQARKIIDKIDQDREAFIRRYFHKDPNDPTAYDLVINMENYQISQGADVIIECLNKRIA